MVSSERPPKRLRSKACDQCRLRRVKCDGASLYCRQCMRLGLQCSGPLDMLIVDMTGDFRQSKGASASASSSARPQESTLSFISFDASTPTSISTKRNAPVATITTPPQAPNSSSSPASSPDASSAFQHQDLDLLGADAREFPETLHSAGIDAKYALPTKYEPGLVETYENLFVTQFAELITPQRRTQDSRPWLPLLLKIHCKSSTPALKFAIRAASMAFYGIVHSDKSVHADSYQWYIAALNAQRAQLVELAQRKENGTPTGIPSIEAVFTPVFLGFFEIYAGTSPGGCMQHFAGANKFLEMRGPKNCRSGPIHQLFCSMRSANATFAVLENKPGAFSSNSWLTVPFGGKEKAPLHQLIDIVLGIPNCLGVTKRDVSLKVFFEQPQIPEESRQSLVEGAERMLQELSKWWELFESTSLQEEHDNPQPSPENGETPQNVKNAVKAYDGYLSDLQDFRYFCPPITYATTLKAYATAIFNASNVILQLVLLKFSPNANEAFLTDQISAHCASILAVANFQEISYPIGFDIIRTVFALVIVLMLSPSQLQREQADQILDRWKSRLCLNGLCGEMIDFQQWR